MLFDSEIKKSIRDYKRLMKALPPAPEKGEALTGHEIKGAKKTPPKKYRESGASDKSDYADPGNYKYPIHTADNVRAAMAYLAKPKNYGVYNPDQRKSVAQRISEAAKKFNVSVSEDWLEKMGIENDLSKCNNKLKKCEYGHKFSNGLLTKE